MMTHETIYKELWCKDDEFVRKIIADSVASPVLRAMGLFIVREYEKAKVLIENNPEVSPDDVIYQELKLYFDLSRDKNRDLLLYQQTAETLIDKAPWLIYTRLLLGNIFEQQKRLDDANKRFREVLESCPNNIVAMAGVIRIFIRKHEYRQALSVLQTKSKTVIAGLAPTKKQDWQLILFTYHLFSLWGEKVFFRFTFGLLILFSAFLPHTFWIIPGVFFLFFIGLSVYLFQKDTFAFSMCFTTAIYVPALWLLGLLLELIFHFTLFAITGS